MPEVKGRLRVATPQPPLVLFLALPRLRLILETISEAARTIMRVMAAQSPKPTSGCPERALLLSNHEAPTAETESSSRSAVPARSKDRAPAGGGQVGLSLGLVSALLEDHTLHRFPVSFLEMRPQHGNWVYS